MEGSPSFGGAVPTAALHLQREENDAGDADVLAEIVRLDREHHRPIAVGSDLADSI